MGRRCQTSDVKHLKRFTMSKNRTVTPKRHWVLWTVVLLREIHPCKWKFTSNVMLLSVLVLWRMVQAPGMDMKLRKSVLVDLLSIYIVIYIYIYIYVYQLNIANKGTFPNEAVIVFFSSPTSKQNKPGCPRMPTESQPKRGHYLHFGWSIRSCADPNDSIYKYIYIYRPY